MPMPWSRTDEHGAIAVALVDGDVDGLALAVLDGVGEQVRHHLLEPRADPSGPTTGPSARSETGHRASAS